jgi:hypothetical protein
MNPTDMSPALEAASHSVIQVFPNILWNAKVHRRVQKGSSLYPLFRHMNFVHTAPFN